jgi:hypothetical protein
MKDAVLALNIIDITMQAGIDMPALIRKEGRIISSSKQAREAGVPNPKAGVPNPKEP